MRGEEDSFFRLPGEEVKLSCWDSLSDGAEVEEGRVHTVFSDREEEERGGLDEPGAGGVYQRGFDEEDRAAGQGLGNR